MEGNDLPEDREDLSSGSDSDTDNSTFHGAAILTVKRITVKEQTERIWN